MKRPKDLFGNPIRATREDAIHAGIVEFLCMAGHPKLLFFHPVNGALVKPSARMYFARLGVFPGVADLVLVLPDKSVAFMEVKGEDGRQSEAQKAFQAKCALLGLKYRVVRSISEAEEILHEWRALRGSEEWHRKQQERLDAAAEIVRKGNEYVKGWKLIEDDGSVTTPGEVAVDNSIEPASDNWEPIGAAVERVVSKLDRTRKKVA